ncbi:uncharacterized protein B0H18DRAFT_958875 [Fomitopsis serialis]|nr:uncharacterized protein B0H18DRAFT_958875 [Neoantrodia serialis]KAH9916370.1 hypothetical protein B0H18DRAFT_958875 [Neoantrodia serialis]
MWSYRKSHCPPAAHNNAAEIRSFKSWLSKITTSMKGTTISMVEAQTLALTIGMLLHDLEKSLSSNRDKYNLPDHVLNTLHDHAFVKDRLLYACKSLAKEWEEVPKRSKRLMNPPGTGSDASAIGTRIRKRGRKGEPVSPTKGQRAAKKPRH